MKLKSHNEPHAQRENGIKKSIFVEKKVCGLHGQGVSDPRDSNPYPLGWLKNGNPPGDLAKAQRCNARSKRTGKPCRQPAMANSKCRLHGGLSTGPRTSEGLARSRKANWKHGEYSQDAKEEMRALRQGLALFLNPGAIFNMTPLELHTHKAALNRLVDKMQRGLLTPYRTTRQ